ncbi:indoleamine 2,3-dioxygenase, partial [Sphingomonas sp.]|uniref:indoleamine 2,3-dioxygenase n=1 Tax=Sphingomonas sp. TaxID=28214 RepID=UPI001DA3268B
MQPLDAYGLSARHGFLSPVEADAIALPPDFDAVDDAGAMLPDYLASGRVRHWLAALPLPDLPGFVAGAAEAELNAAMLRYAFLAQAWVWGEETPVDRLPACLAVPLATLADRLGLKPIMTYQHYVLDNWFRLDKAGEIALGNLAIDQHFAGGRDESGFILVHVAIEATAGAVLAACVALAEAARDDDAPAAEAGLAALHAALVALNAGLAPMAGACDPYVYFHRVRPYMFGWPGAGLIYEGVAAFGGRPVPLRGQTGSQSSIVPAVDAVLGVPHGASALSAFLDEIHAYRPPRHRAFIDDLRRHALRPLAAREGGLREAYNGCLEQLARFRDAHLALAARYIALPAAAAGKEGETGTGGTPFLTYLAQHRDDSRAG